MERLYLSAEHPPSDIWEEMQNGAVLVSEPFFRRVGLGQQGAAVTLYTDSGAKAFPVFAVFHDYFSSEGGGDGACHF